MVIDILNMNAFESDEAVWRGLSSAQVLDKVYNELSVAKVGDDLYEVSEQLGVLLETKKVNPPAHFSMSFKVGVYLPILSPFLVPIVMTGWLVLKHKLFNT